MPMITTMVGEVWVDDAIDWGNETAMTALVKEPLEDASNIRVCVRVRPPNKRELALPGGVVVEVGKDEQTVTVTGKQPFIFDVAFPTEVGQLDCFSKIGLDIVKTAYNGYNASMFAYGQTASGKSFSMMGVRGTALVGLIPRIAHLLFTVISLTPDKQFFVEGSFLEIYNEKLRDLLDFKGTDDLKVRESPQLGVHVAGLSRHTVKSSEAVEKVIEDGTGNRTVAATKYNSESSRSHAVFELHVQQKYKDELTGEEMQSKTKIALIDLAGSERSDKLGSVGKALKEGNNINKSLTVLGRCIKGLVDKANNPKKKINVPFRESVLTYYLRESLAGNARTTMLAAVSPAGSNEEETMSTLRYAASAKQIKTSAKKSEDPLKAKVRELAMEVEKLKRQLAEGGMDGAGFENAEEEEVSLMSLIGGAGKQKVRGALSSMNAQERSEYMKEIEAQMKLLGQDGFAIAQQEADAEEEEEEERVHDKLVFPQLSCLNKDDMLSHAMVIPIGTNTEAFMIGRSGGEEENDFELDGMGIQEKHCEITLAKAAKQITAVIRSATRGAQTTLNGVVLEAEDPSGQPLQHLDRVVFGPCRMLCLYLTHPLTPEEKASWTYTKTFREFTSSGAADQSELMSPARQELVDHLNEIAQNLAQANIIASEMCTTLSFKSQVQVGHAGLSKVETTVDDLLSRNDFRVIVSCVAGTKTLKSVEHLGKVNSHNKSMEGGASLGAALSAEAALEGDTDAQSKLHGHEAGGNWKHRELFEMEAEDFGDLLASLKATHSNLQSLTGGLADASEGNNIENMVKKIFDAIDMDGSGVIDREELAAAIIRFDRNHDPQFLDRVLEEENLVDMEVDMTYPQFEEFLIRFLQHQFYENLETYVTNKQLFMRLGGRAVTMSSSGEKIFHRKSMAAGGDGTGGDGDGSGGGSDDPLDHDDEDDSAAERQAKGARAAAKAAARAKAEALKKKGMDQMLGLSIEEHRARANKRVSEHARVQYFESVLLTDLKHAAHDLDLLLQSNTRNGRGVGGVVGLPLLACFGASAAQKKKAKTDRGIVNALKDVVKNSFRELQILQTATSHSNKHRSELERMVEALLEKQEEDEKQAQYAANGGGYGGGGGGGDSSAKKKKKKGVNVGFAGSDDEASSGGSDEEKAARVEGGDDLEL